MQKSRKEKIKLVLISCSLILLANILLKYLSQLDTLFVIPSFLVGFILIITPMHEWGHYIFAKILGIRTAGMVLDFWVIPRAVMSIKSDDEIRNIILELGSLIFLLSTLPLLAFFWKTAIAPIYHNNLYWMLYIGGIFASAGIDLIMVLNDLFGGEKVSSIQKKAQSVWGLFFPRLHITSKENFGKWKKQYPQQYEELRKANRNS